VQILKLAVEKLLSPRWDSANRTFAVIADEFTGCSKRLSARPQRVKGRGVPVGYVEGLNDARTTLAGFFSILLERGHDEFDNRIFHQVLAQAG